MKYTKIYYTNKDNTPFSLADMCNNSTRFDVTDSVEDAKDSEDLCKRLNSLSLFEHDFVVDRKTETYLRLKSHDFFGNTHFLIIHF